MAPVGRGRASSSHVPTDLMKEYYTQRASAGLIITESLLIAPNTSVAVGQPGVFTRDQLYAWKAITDAVHDKGGKMFAQLWHPGRTAHPDNNNGAECVGPSAIAVDGEAHTSNRKKAYPVPRELTATEIQAIVELFATAATNAIQVAGFDGVEVHAANGYLIDQFLRSSANSRTDGYGGSLENRGRFLTEVLEAVTDAVGSRRVGIRFSPLNSFHSMNDTDPLALSEHTAKISQRFNLAYVHVVRRDFMGVQEGDILPIFREHFQNTLISNLRYTKDEANLAIGDGEIDAVAFGVQFIANPDLPQRFAQNAPLNVADPSTFYVGGAKGYIDYPTLGEL
ncbi:unnamed protein product [Aphanomyces euteiches]